MATTTETKVPFTVEEAFVATMRQVGPIAKGQRNEHQKYNFRGIDDVLNEVHVAMADNGLFALPNVESVKVEWRESSSGNDMVHVFLIVRYDFYCESGGGPLSMTIPAEGRDSSDKGTNKAMSAALKYGLIQCFAIPTQETADADRTTPESRPPRQPDPVQEDPVPERREVPLDALPEGTAPLTWTKQVAAAVTAKHDPAGDMALEWWKDSMILNDLMGADDEPGKVETLTAIDAMAVVEILVQHLEDYEAEKEANDEDAHGGGYG